MDTRLKILTTLFAAALAAFLAAAHAHSDAYFDANPSPHGGQIRMAGAYHFELLVELGALTVYVTDHADAPIATDGATAVAIVEAARKTTKIQLAPAGANVLKGTGAFAADDPAMRVKLTVTMAGMKAETARFTPLQRKARAQ